MHVVVQSSETSGSQKEWIVTLGGLPARPSVPPPGRRDGRCPRHMNRFGAPASSAGTPRIRPLTPSNGPLCCVHIKPHLTMQARATMQRSAAPRRAAATSRRLTVSVQNANVLIANTKGGGHAFIGLYLAKELMKRGHKITILNDGDQVSQGSCTGASGDPRILTRPIICRLGRAAAAHWRDRGHRSRRMDASTDLGWCGALNMRRRPRWGR